MFLPVLDTNLGLHAQRRRRLTTLGWGHHQPLIHLQVTANRHVE